MKNNGDIITFLKQKDYTMVNNNLGSGSFGKTVLIKDPFIDELFVAKKIEPELTEFKEQFYKSFLQEIKILYKLHHRNVVRIFNYYAYERIFTGYIVIEYIDGDSIEKYFSQYDELWSKSTPDSIFTQLIEAFEYIEANNIVHRDIREGNILIDKTGIVKVIDFGLGKTFKPVDVVDDSMNSIVNRSGLDALPEEYFQGSYDSQTDMFYLAELFKRLLVKSDLDKLLSYSAILEKMMSQKKENRYFSFTEIQNAIKQKDFSNLPISEEDKEIYQKFSNAIITHLKYFLDGKKFFYDVDEFQKKIADILSQNCFEDLLQSNSDLISAVVACGYRYNDKIDIPIYIIQNISNWFNQLSITAKQLVLNNIIVKLSSRINEELSDDTIPF